MKLPAFQFYPGDWLKDPNLRRCTHTAKGVWMDLLCLMFESEERGVLVTSQRPWSDQEIALAVGGDLAVVLACVEELTLKGVAHRRNDSALFSKRLVRDEHKRALCVTAGKRGGNPNLTRTHKGHSKGDPNGPPKPKPTPSASSSSSDEERNRDSPPLARPKDVEEALAYAGTREGYDPETVKHWYASRDGAGWERVNGALVRNWRSDLDGWALRSVRDAKAAPARNTGPAQRNASPKPTSQYSW